MVFTTDVFCSLSLVKLKTEGHRKETENLTEKFKILANPGLA